MWVQSNFGPLYGLTVLLWTPSLLSIRESFFGFASYVQTKRGVSCCWVTGRSFDQQEHAMRFSNFRLEYCFVVLYETDEWYV